MKEFIINYKGYNFNVSILENGQRILDIHVDSNLLLADNSMEICEEMIECMGIK